MDIINSGIYIENDKLYDYAASAARLMRPTGESSGRSALAELRRDMGRIRLTYDAVKRRYGELASPPVACEWLLDNFYMAQREYAGAAEALERAGRLRRCEDGVMITQLCKSLVNAGQGSVSEERCAIFLDGFQSVTALRRAELELFPTAVRAALLGALAGVCGKMQYAADTSPHAAAFEAMFSGLRLFSVLDTERLISSADVTGAVLAADPSGDYPNMDSGTQREYLRRVERLARRAGMEEHILARRLILRAREENRHIGFFLFEEKKRGAAVYIAANVLAPLFISLLIAFLTEGAATALLLLLPISELVKAFLDYILIHTLRPTRLPRMDTEKTPTADERTICVISALLTDAESARRMTARLEELRQVCAPGRGICFGLLADLPEADTERCPADGEILAAAEDKLGELNRKYGGGFYVFHRGRSYDGEHWSPHERKRGAITELARMLCDMESQLRVCGDRDGLSGISYILTLDSDTRIYPGSAEELIGAMLHPLNRPVTDEKRRVVTGGHAVIHPRMAVELSSAGATDFALIFAGAGGSDPYGGLCGELYMDAFGSGGFAGKGIIDARAFIKCMDNRLPEGRILSHDALEGAYLRGAFMGDAEFSDAFPARPLAYYKRLHRWVRGDWQNLPWIFRRELSAIDRYRLFDSLRRSLLPPMTLAAILRGLLLPRRGMAAAWAALLALLSTLLLSLAESSGRPRERVRLQRFTRLLTGVGGAIVQTFIRLWLLPYEAWVCLSAIVTALWRMCVSHRRLLQWQTAAQAELGSGGLKAHGGAMWQAALLGLALVFVSPVIIGKAAGLMWLLSPLAAAALALPARREQELSREDRELVRQCAEKNFRYLTEFSTAADNYLPPDNFQEQPPVGIAHRTSPTNIGLALTAAVAACDMEFFARTEAVEYIGRITGTLERMPRHMGHYYNWYDTRTLLPLDPPFISTVDSGNLCAGLLTTAAALEQWDEGELAGRLRTLAAEMDFKRLYDRERNLFYICYDTVQNRGAGGWYDLMASEAMLTSYLAVARGDAPVKHWRRLSRAQLQKDGYRGLASWTGTMFEYLMPELFLPFYRGSLLHESGRFCVYAQKRRVFAGKPWGISESAYYSLDRTLSYRYKANGCAALALRRGQDADMVVSPYSSYLALSIDPHGSARNMRRLREFGAEGRFGFMEALDFSPSRCRREEGERVRCYMAHHIGMSVIAAANALCGHSIQRRFMANSAMGAYSLLLQERLPDSGAVIRRDMAQRPEKPERSSAQMWRVRGAAEDDERRFALLSNGAYNILADNRGGSAAALCSTAVYGSTAQPSERGAELELEYAGRRVTLPGAETELWELSEDESRVSFDRAGLKCSVSLWTAAGEWGERRCLELEARENMSVSLRLSFRPILAPYEDYRNHPAFWRLGICAEQTENALLLHRLRRGGQEEIWLCLSCDRQAGYSGEGDRKTQALSEPEAAARLCMELKAGDRETVSFAVCLGSSRREALAGAERILATGDRGNMAGAAAARLGMSGEETGAAMDMLGELLSPVCGALPKRELWRYGVSGDMPIICCDAGAAECLPLLRRFCLLRSCGAECELVYLSGEDGEYVKPRADRIREELAAAGLEALLGERGGVWLVPRSATELIESRAAVCVGRERRRLPAADRPTLSGPRRRGSIPRHGWSETGFEFLVKDSLPGRIWQHMLSNGRFGCIVSDCGAGLMWQDNARELRINSPVSDIRAAWGTELLWTQLKGRSVSLFAANDGLPCRVSFGRGFARWEKELDGRRISTVAFVPDGIDARVLIISGAAGLRLNWLMEIVLGAENAAGVRTAFANGIFTAENPDCYIPGTRFRAGSSGVCSSLGEFSPPAMYLSILCGDCTVLACGCCGEQELRQLLDEGRAHLELEKQGRRWQRLLSRFKADTGCAQLDRYLNLWALYQGIACRLECRCSLYQSGGAFGFRDQLQDAVNLILIDPAFARERILDCCRHQYRQGDVMHWWHRHPEGDRGIRSRCSDDMLWLCWALCEYVAATGDEKFCQLKEGYVDSKPLDSGERDRYERPEAGVAPEPVLNHAAAALDCCAARGFGPHGLPFFGSGDWNDGLDCVDGESVWLGWFLSGCALSYAALLDRLGRGGGERYRELAERVGRAADAAFDGEKYLRGYMADGSPLGGGQRIDSLPQSWAVFSSFSSPDRAQKALDTALERLIDREHGLVKLFDPPFTGREPYPGYIVSYGEGFRENGGQYTHGAVWLAMACFESGRSREGWEIMKMLLPGNREPGRYEAEPFVLAADVYSAPGHEGEAGWSWYTGSALWYFRAAAESMLGLRLRDGALELEPHLPEELGECRVRYTHPDGKSTEIRLRGGEKE